MANTQNRHTHILFWNAQSIQHKKQELLNLLQSDRIPVALINETHLRAEDKFSTRNFTSYRSDRQDRRGGGVAILVHKTIDHHKIEIPPLNRTEAVAIKLEANGHPVTIVSVYNPPGDIDTDDLEALLQISNSVIIAGDLNAKHRDWQCKTTNPPGTKLYDLYYNGNQNFQILAPAEPTHIPDQVSFEPDILDIALVKNVRNNITIKTLNNLDSDHLPVLLTMRGQIKFAEQRSFLQYHLANWERFQLDINNNVPDLDLKTENELNNGVQVLTKVIQAAIAHNIPERKIKYNKPFIPDSIKRLIRQRNDARRKWQRHHGNQNFRQQMNDLRYQIRRAMLEHVSSTWDNALANLDTTNMTKTWNLAKRIMHKNVELPPINTNTGQATTPNEKAEAFTRHLVQTFSPNNNPNNNNFIRQTENIVENFIQHPPRSTIRRTIPAEVAWQIRHLPDKKAPGPDGIQNIVLKRLPPSGIAFLTKIINAILELKIYPTAWKEGRILLFPKNSGDLHNPESYRPITLLNTMGKVAEKIISKRLNFALREMNILRDEQFGFRPKHNTQSQLMRHIKQITKGFREKRVTVGLYLDIKQAFDKVWHKGLIRKMMDMNINDGLIHLIHNYLKNRQFKVNVKGTDSTKEYIKSGVPQGSILGPTLFNLYINDMPHDNIYNNSLLHIFADDTLITGQSRQPILATRQVQKNLNQIEKWLEKWRLTINIDKCQAVLYTKRHSLYRRLPPELKLNGQPINWNTEAKYLGVILDQKLLFKNHINWIRARAFGRLKTLYPMLNYRSHLNLKTALTLYKALLRPIITYACPVWGNASKTHIKKLQVFQNKVLYMITKLPKFTPTWVLHKEAHIETINEYIQQSITRFNDSCQGHSNPMVARLGTHNQQSD